MQEILLNRRSRNEHFGLSWCSILIVACALSAYECIVCGRAGSLLLLPPSVRAFTTTRHAARNKLGTKTTATSSCARYGSSYYDDDTPRRQNGTLAHDNGYRHRRLSQWGFHRQGSPTPSFPGTFAAVAGAACHAITASLYDQARPDPTVASNAMSRSPFHYRPRVPSRAGRLGVEIDGARHLLSTTVDDDDDVVDLEGKALRRLSLLMAARLSRWPWQGLETAVPVDHNDNDNNHHYSRPVAVYFTSLTSALLATRELQYLKAQERLQLQHGVPTGTFYSSFTNVRICCLGQDDIPVEMLQGNRLRMSQNGRPKKKKKKDVIDLDNNDVDPRKGLLLIVQPSSTHGNSAFSPDVVSSQDGHTARHYTAPPIESLQRLVTRATVHRLATVLLSPRFTDTEQHHGGYDRRTRHTADRAGGLDASGYQQSEIYGGSEPPRPSPWLLRDYTPPVFAWVRTTTTTGDGRRATGVGVSHSVLDRGRSWHVFEREKDGDRGYTYVASTDTASGRPSRGILETVLSTKGLSN